MSTDPSSLPESPLKRALRLGSAAAWKNRVPAICLWLFGVALIGAYFFSPTVFQVLERLREWKGEAGLLFAAISTALFAGGIPLAMSRWAGRPVPSRWGAYLLSNLLFWAGKGIEVEAFYRLQAIWFGDQSDWQTIVVKVLADQMVYAPLLGLLNVVLFYRWRDRGYSWAAFRRGLDWKWYRDDFLPVLISNWMVWIPACALIYCLPQGLQLPIQNLILCFWVLILMFFTESQGAIESEKKLTAGPTGP